METLESSSLPTLDLKAWEPTKRTLHMYLQAVGKVQLALMPRRNHWWNITFLPNAKGLVTHNMPVGNDTLEIQFNFLQHQLEITKSSGASDCIILKDGLGVPDFFQRLFTILEKLGVHPVIEPRPFCLPGENLTRKRFVELLDYNHYDKEYVERFWRIVNWSAGVFSEFNGRFYGKSSPVHLFWHHMDLAVTRFCGKRGPELPADSNISNKDAYSHELINFGFWAGDERVKYPAYYSYTYPSPAGIDQVPFRGKGQWTDANGSPMALLSYNDVRKEQQSRAALLDFLEQSYQAGASLLGWDIDDLAVPPISSM